MRQNPSCKIGFRKLRTTQIIQRCVQIKVTPTKRNHINPCFWTALWNPYYFENFIAGQRNGKPRDQMVYSLDFKIPKVVPLKVENVHFVEGLGITVLSESELLELKNVYSADIKKPIEESQLEEDGFNLIDFENHFSEIENFGGYQELLHTVKNNQIVNDTHRIYLAYFIIIHQLRGLKFLYSLFDKYHKSPNPKLESFIHFKDVISDADRMYEVVNPIVNSKWTMYRATEFTFPLSDSPIIYYDNLIWAVLSPKHLIEIDRGKPFSGKVKYRSELTERKFQIFKTQLIKNTFQSIIFSDQNLLEKWSKSKTWNLRKKYLSK